ADAARPGRARERRALDGRGRPARALHAVEWRYARAGGGVPDDRAGAAVVRRRALRRGRAARAERVEGDRGAAARAARAVPDGTRRLHARAARGPFPGGVRTSSRALTAGSADDRKPRGAGPARLRLRRYRRRPPV